MMIGDIESLDHIRRIDNEIRTTDQQAYEQGEIILTYDAQMFHLNKKSQNLQMIGIVVMLALVGISLMIVYIAPYSSVYVCSVSFLIFIGCLISFFIVFKNDDELIRQLTARKASLQSAVAGYQKKSSDLKNAQNLEVAGRYEEAARVYDYYSLVVDAGYVRRKSKMSYVEHSGKVMNISVNMNQLLSEIRDKGLAIPYKCSQCGGSITVSGTSSSESLYQCPFCGMMLYNIVDFLKSILH